MSDVQKYVIYYPSMDYYVRWRFKDENEGPNQDLSIEKWNYVRLNWASKLSKEEVKERNLVIFSNPNWCIITEEEADLREIMNE